MLRDLMPELFIVPNPIAKIFLQLHIKFSGVITHLATMISFHLVVYCLLKNACFIFQDLS